MLFNAHAMDGQALWSRYKMEYKKTVEYWTGCKNNELLLKTLFGGSRMNVFGKGFQVYFSFVYTFLKCPPKFLVD